LFDAYSKPRITLVGKSQKDARRLIEAFDERFDVRYEEEVSSELWNYSDMMVFDYVNNDLLSSARHQETPHLFLINDESQATEFHLSQGEYLFKGPGYLNYLADIVFSILEKERLKKTLEFEREKYMGLVNSMGCGMLVVRKRDSGILFSNRVSLSVLGYTEHEISDKKLDEIVMGGLASILPGDSEKENEVALLTRSGDNRFVQFSSSEILYGAERVIQFSFMDITQHKRTREELYFQGRFLDNVEEIAIAIDENGRIAYANNHAAKIHGLRIEDMLANQESQYLSCAASTLRDRNMELFKNGVWKGKEYRIRKDGTVFAVYVVRTLSKIAGQMYELVVGREIADESQEHDSSLFEDTLGILDQCVIILQESGNVVFANKSAQELLSHIAPSFEEKQEILDRLLRKYAESAERGEVSIELYSTLWKARQIETQEETLFVFEGSVNR
jgi:PAS domain S-box-containing protein